MFTYNADAPTSDRDKLRLYLGDTAEGAGPRVGGANYTDGELDLFLAQAGTWAGGVLLALRALANEWAAAAYNIKTGQTAADYSGVAEELRKRAAEWAATWVLGEMPGAVGTGATAGRIALDWWETNV